MQSTRTFFVVLVVSTVIAVARVVPIWSYHQLLDSADLVAIATVVATDDTQERIDAPGFNGERVIGVETKFAVSAVLKGDESLKEFILHHYRPLDGPNISHVPNGPTFLSFTPARNPTSIPPAYLLFLRRDADGRYAPIVGQTDPGLAIRELRAVAIPGE